MLGALLLAPFVKEVATTTARAKATTKMAVSPVRRIVSMLQLMSAKVEAEGEKTDKLFEKFMCYCKSGTEKTGGAIEAAEEKIPQVESDIKASKESEAQLKKELEEHKADRAEAEAAIAKAKGIREKEAKAFAAESGDSKSNIAALGKAIPAIEKGMGSAFLQTGGANRLRAIFSSDADLSPADRDLVRSFLQGGQGYEPASGEIVGIMKQMKDTMEKDLAEITQNEEAAIADFQGLVGANQKVIAGATKAIEAKTARVGDVAVDIVNLEEDLDDTSKGLVENKAMLLTLTKECDAKTKDHAVVVKTRQEELLALADTIRMLNEDDATSLFQQVVPSASVFLQVSDSSDEVRAQAVQALRSTLRRGSASGKDYRMNMLLLAMKGKKVGFEKVITMLDEMVALLKKEQVDDDNKKAYCEAEIDKAEDEIKTLKGHISDLSAAIENNKESMAAVVEDIKALTDGIVELDRDVATATMQRKDEHTEYEKTLVQNNAAVQLVERAKNRMQKFYNPKLYKPEPKRELTEEERITVNMGGTLAPTAPPTLLQVSARAHLRQPEAFSQTEANYGKKSEEAGGVLAMMDMLKADIEKETQEMDFEEKDSQKEYEAMVNEAYDKRAGDKKAIQQKEGAKAALEEGLLQLEKEKKSRSEESLEAQKYLADLMSDCQWLTDNYDTRKEARANEVEALQKAKAVLSGADYSFVQTSVHHHLRKA
jgi:chromosome segregation ATPase